MNRRTFLQKGGLLGGIFVVGTPFLLPRMSRSGSLARVERVYISMGTTVRFLVFHEDAHEALAAIHEAQALVQRVHDLMSVQQEDSELSRWNRSTRGLDAPFDPFTAQALDEAFLYKELTDGRFDPTVGAAVDAAERGLSGINVPISADAWNGVERRLEKEHSGLRIDLGGSAKGWAVDHATEILRRCGAAGALVNAGGDLRVTGRHPDGTAWRIGIRDPRNPDGIFCDLEITEGAVATSGGYALHGSTIVDPRDGHRIRFRGSATVLADSCGEADCLSTAACVDPDALLPSATDRVLVARPVGEGLRVDRSSAFPSRAVDPYPTELQTR